ncbi:ribosomal protein S5 domain 2-type protein [Amanita rubescens]|nr:ribosomal protein S5 domain 2-type protein [Amanita rubescens]
MAQAGSDRRRITGPEDSSPPLFAPDEKESRGDVRQGRNAGDVRPIFLQPGLINQANGSAYIETERTKIACAVYGPRQSKNVAYHEKGKLNVEVKFAPFSCHQRRAPLRDAEDRSLSLAIYQALVPAVRLELLPKSTIDVFITVVEADGIDACIAAATTAASTALADAGIEMIGLVTSCSAAIVGGEVWLDLTEAETQLSIGSLVLACLPALGTITSIWQTGSMTMKESFQCMNQCQSQCTDIHGVVAQALRDSG